MVVKTPNSPEGWVTALAGLGVRIDLAGDRLRIAPASRIPPEWIGPLQEAKPSLLAYLRGQAAPPKANPPLADLEASDRVGPTDRTDPEASVQVGQPEEAKGEDDRPMGQGERPGGDRSDPGTEAYPAAVCPRCGSTGWKDTPIHNGQSLRRNCARCGKFLGFPVWYGKPTEAARPDPIHPDRIDRLLAWGQSHGWPELVLSDWDLLPSGQRRWELFLDWLSQPKIVPAEETTRRRLFWQTLLAIERYSEAEGNQKTS